MPISVQVVFAIREIYNIFVLKISKEIQFMTLWLLIYNLSLHMPNDEKWHLFWSGEFGDYGSINHLSKIFHYTSSYTYNRVCCSTDMHEVKVRLSTRCMKRVKCQLFGKVHSDIFITSNIRLVIPLDGSAQQKLALNSLREFWCNLYEFLWLNRLLLCLLIYLQNAARLGHKEITLQLQQIRHARIWHRIAETDLLDSVTTSYFCSSAESLYRKCGDGCHSGSLGI